MASRSLASPVTPLFATTVTKRTDVEFHVLAECLRLSVGRLSRQEMARAVARISPGVDYVSLYGGWPGA